MTQFIYFLNDFNRLLGKNKFRFIHIIFSRVFYGILLYRTERSLFLFFGNSYKIIRVPLIPFFNLFQAFSNIDIHYEANIKGGIIIHHPSVGCVISGKTKIGKNITLTGGNVIGISKHCEIGDFVIGDNCSLGVNATIIGPLKLSNNITIGANACVVKDCLSDNEILVGVPAKKLF